MVNDKRYADGKANLFAEGTGLRNLAERNGVEVVDILLRVQAALNTLAEEEPNIVSEGANGQ